MRHLTRIWIDVQKIPEGDEMWLSDVIMEKISDQMAEAPDFYHVKVVDWGWEHHDDLS